MATFTGMHLMMFAAGDLMGHVCFWWMSVPLWAVRTCARQCEPVRCVFGYAKFTTQQFHLPIHNSIPQQLCKSIFTSAASCSRAGKPKHCSMRHFLAPDTQTHRLPSTHAPRKRTKCFANIPNHPNHPHQPSLQRPQNRPQQPPPQKQPIPTPQAMPTPPPAQKGLTIVAATRRTALVAGTAAIVGGQIATSPVINFGQPAFFPPVNVRLDWFVTGSANADSEEAFRKNPQVPRVKLAEGLEVSQVVKGCMQLSGISHRGFRGTDNTQGDAVIADLRRFAAAGITSLDTADTFGNSEVQIGRYLQLTPNAKERTQVMTKLSFYGFSEVGGAASKRYVEQKVQERCQRLGVKKLDVVQLYWNNYDVNNYTTVALHLMDLKEKGLLGHLGASNFDTVRLQQMQDAGVRFATSQVQYSLLDRRAEILMEKFCERNNISLVPYGVLAGGFLADRFVKFPEARIDLDTYSKHHYKRVIDLTGGWKYHQRLVSTLQEVAQKHNTSVANVAMRWILDRPTVGAIIVGARNANHLADHQQLSGVKLDADDVGKIKNVLGDGKRIKGDCYNWERQDWAVET